MRFQRFFFVFFILIMSLLISGQRPANLVMRRKFHRHSCLQRRCMPLHSRVPLP
ncbi:apelin receptor early endogenous ligand [Dugong dugon]